MKKIPLVERNRRSACNPHTLCWEVLFGRMRSIFGGLGSDLNYLGKYKKLYCYRYRIPQGPWQTSMTSILLNGCETVSLNSPRGRSREKGSQEQLWPKTESEGDRRRHMARCNVEEKRRRANYRAQGNLSRLTLSHLRLHAWIWLPFWKLPVARWKNWRWGACNLWIYVMSEWMKQLATHCTNAG